MLAVAKLVNISKDKRREGMREWLWERLWFKREWEIGMREREKKKSEF